MCSRLHIKLSTGRDAFVMPSDQLPYRHDGEVLAGMWGANFGSKLVGFARVETVREKWLGKGWQTCTVPIADFAEGHQQVTWAGIAGDLAALVRWGEVVIVTRQATPAEAARLSHHRVPVQVVDGRMTLPSKGGLVWFS